MLPLRAAFQYLKALAFLCALLTFSNRLGAQIRIPVVVHIISQDPESIPDSRIYEGIADLNEAFSHTGRYAAGSGANTGISFCLAKKDPEGGISVGITRTQSSLANMDIDIEDRRLKNLISWDPSRYMNIWLVESAEGEMFARFACGQWTREKPGSYASFVPGDFRDGVVTPGFGPELARLTGLYLGLRPIFTYGSCANNNCLLDGDGVCDTPPMALPGGSCTNPQNSCTTDTLSGFSTEQRDMNENFMSFSSCARMFTEGQANKMRATIASSRSLLVAADNACTPTCNAAILARFTRDNWNPVPGTIVTFSSQSSSGNNFEWRINDVVVGANSPTLAHRFSETGKYRVSLRVFNSNRACYASHTHYVHVTCGVLASFFPNKRTIASKAPFLVDTIVFTNRSYNATGFQWLVRSGQAQTEQVVSTNRDLAFPYLEPGNYQVRLVAFNGSCRDTSDAFVHSVQDATMDGSVYAYGAECYRNTKVRLFVGVCNNGFDTIPAGVPISFYDADPRLPGAHKLDTSFILPNPVLGKCCGQAYPLIIETGKVNVNELWVVFGDKGTAVPIALPNSGFTETSYQNNVNQLRGFRFTAAVDPPAVTLQPGDTLNIRGYAGPGLVSRFNWSPPAALSCTSCETTTHIATRDDLRVKLVATSTYGCSDSAFAAVRVPAADDFNLTLDGTTCVPGDSVELSFTVCNLFRRGFIPAGLKVSFYNGDPAAGGKLLTGSFRIPVSVSSLCQSYRYRVPSASGTRIYGVVNDKGVSPFQLPNDTVMTESSYANNVSVIEYQPFRVFIDPASASLEPGDTLRLRARSTGDSVVQYAWNPSNGLSCSQCPAPVFTAERNSRQYTFIGANVYGCRDTADRTIQVPPRDDLQVRIQAMDCSGEDSIRVRFELCNTYARAILPAGIKVSFYDGDPRNGASLLGPVFSLPDGASIPCAAYVHQIRATGARQIFAVVNDRGSGSFALPNDTLLAEVDYANNIVGYDYAPEPVIIRPADTAILRNTSVRLAIESPIHQASSIQWRSLDNLPVSCTNCLEPQVTAVRSGRIEVSMLNAWGCRIRGEATVNILAPDMTIVLTQMACFSASSSRVWFRLCMNNQYDSVWQGIPVSFYDRDPATGSARSLGNVFLTPSLQAGGCAEYSTIINTPAGGVIWAGVNDKGGGSFPARQFEETNDRNNTASIAVVPFRVEIAPADTFIYRNSQVQLIASASGGRMSQFNWEPGQYLSCTTCLNPVARVPYTQAYVFTAQNENECVASDTVHIRMFTDGPVNIPNAFTPNGDGLNDVFYIMGSRDVESVQDLSIYDRFGHRIFQQKNAPPNDPRYGWTGHVSGSPGGTNSFVYAVKVRFRDGREQLFRGTITVIR